MKQNPRRPKRGAAMLYSIVLIFVLVGFTSLGVDFGRVQVAKTELRRAADAAARYGSQGLSDGTAVSKAQAAALDNKCDNTNVVLLASDITTGNWNSTTHVFVAGGTPTNAIQVIAARTVARGNPIPLVFAKVIGRNDFSITATSIATGTSSRPPFGVVGLSTGLLQNGTILVDSYKSANGAYGGSNILTDGYVATNGGITMTGGVTVHTDLYMQAGQSITANGSPSYGQRQTLAAPLVYPTVGSAPTGSTSLGNVNAGTTLGSGTTNTNYYCTGIVINSGQTLNINGPVTLYINGNCTLNGTIQTLNNLPANFKIMMMASAGVNIGMTSSLYADVYAPQSPININTTPNIYGRLIGGQLSVSGTTAIHYDESLAAPPGTVQRPPGTGVVTMVK